MKVTVFSHNPSKFAHEEKQLQEIVTLLQSEPSESPVYMLTNIIIDNNEIDCILLTEKGPLLIDCKAYQGKIFGCQNGDWWIETNGGRIDIPKNLFQQARDQRYAFLKIWGDIAKKHFKKQIPEEQIPFFKVWQYFKPGSEFADERFKLERIRWYGIVTKDTLLDDIKKLNIQYRISHNSYEKILHELGLSIQDEVGDVDPVGIEKIDPPIEPDVKIIPDPDISIDDEDEKEKKPVQIIVTPPDSVLPIPVVILKGPIKITIPVKPKSRPPELITAVAEAYTYLEMDKLGQGLNLANYALSIDKYDREAQDIKYDILYRLNRGDEAEEFIEAILRGE